MDYLKEVLIKDDKIEVKSLKIEKETEKQIVLKEKDSRYLSTIRKAVLGYPSKVIGGYSILCRNDKEVEEAKITIKEKMVEDIESSYQQYTKQVTQFENVFNEKYVVTDS